jgi:molybdenum cofactor cytidylyltransferase
MIFAVIPAAGHSTRMGRPKLDLPIAGRPVLAHVVDALQQGGVDGAVVVLGPHVAHLAAAAPPAHAFILPAPTPDMRTTVEHGLRWLEEQFHPGDADAWLLAPADHPTLAPEVVRLLLQARGEHPEQEIFVPTCGGRRGHPTLLTWRTVAALRSHPRTEGLNTFIRGRAPAVREVPVDDPEVLADLDTPEDYQRLLARRPFPCVFNKGPLS